jgi:putative transcriptional regulator
MGPKKNTPGADEREHRVAVRLDEVLADRGMTLAELARRVGISAVNLSVLKNGHARAIRFSTLTDICDVLECTPGDLLVVEPRED